MAESDSSVYSTAKESEKSYVDTSSSEDDLIEQSSVVQAYSNEPLASTSATDDEDGIPSAILPKDLTGLSQLIYGKSSRLTITCI